MKRAAVLFSVMIAAITAVAAPAPNIGAARARRGVAR